MQSSIDEEMREDDRCATEFLIVCLLEIEDDHSGLGKRKLPLTSQKGFTGEEIN